ncbi:MAG: hypothetical protein R2710_12960 [Acidimicrobiales bacterium]
MATGRYELGVVHSWGNVSIDVPDHVERRSIANDVADVILHRCHRLATRDVLTLTT